MTTTPNTPRDESPSDEIGVDDRTRELPAGDTPVSGASAPATAPPGSASTALQQPEASSPSGTATATRPAPGVTAAPGVNGPAAAEPTYQRGPAPFAIVLGILGLLVAGLTLVGELTDLSIPWDDLGPWTVVAAGIVVLLVGAIGLRASRTQD